MRLKDVAAEQLAAVNEFTNAEFFLGLVERYQSNKPEYIKRAKERVEKATAECERLLKDVVGYRE